MTPAEPTLEPLSYRHRTWFFRGLLTLFVLCVPVFMFYATGYRVSLTDIDTIVSVGGIFVSAETDNTTIYLDDELVDNYRLFQQAAYIQNLPAGVYRLTVQGDGLHTWVKELPVYPHIVTETMAFNTPLEPQIRLVQPFMTATGTQVLFEQASSTMSDFGTVRVPIMATATTATSSFFANEEYDFVADLFASSTATSSPNTLRSRIATELEATFTFSSNAPTSTVATSSTATTTQVQANRQVAETATGLVVTWLGSSDTTPYYFCRNIVPPSASTSALRSYVANNLIAAESALESSARGDFVCRDTIMVETFDREIRLFDFFPGLNDWLLVHLSDGLYAVEIDDRGWQNTQRMYASETMEVAVFGEQIFVHDQGYYFELLTELAN